MFKSFRSKGLSIFIIAAFLLFASPNFTVGADSAGNLIGFVYGEDGTTPVEGAIVKLRSIASGSVFESSKTDTAGVFKVEGLEQGLYTLGIVTKEGGYNVQNIVGVKANETAKLSLSLRQLNAKEDDNQGLGAFFTSPIGIGVIIVATAAIIYGIVKLTEKEEEASPFKR